MRTDTVDALSELIAELTADAPTLQLPSPELVEQYRDQSNRVLWIEGEISQATLSVMRDILEYNRDDKDTPIEERKPIKIFINTQGGDVTVMWSLVNAIKISKTPVYTINFSEALSAGAHILAAGHKRFGMPGSTVLIHSGSCIYGGTAEQADSAKKYYDALNKKADDALLSMTGIDKKVFNKKKVIDWFISAEEALEYRIIDGIVEDFSEIL